MQPPEAPPPRSAAAVQRAAGADPAQPLGVVSAQPGETLNLLAGQLYFGGEAARVQTLLGSCVALTLWHPLHRLGGMCHFLLPQRQRPPQQRADARYGDEAIAWLVTLAQRVGTRPADYQAHLYGGADTLPGLAGYKFNVGQRNIELARALVERHGFALNGVDVGAHTPRHVELELASGRVRMRRTPASAPAANDKAIRR